ncbi:Uncharacterised protein [marine metagenome]
MAKQTLKIAETSACQIVNQIAEKSASTNVPNPSPLEATAAAVPKENISRAKITAPPSVNRKVIAITLSATPIVHPYAKRQRQRD